MGRFGRGEVVVIPFPFVETAGGATTGGAGSRRRPALVLAALAGDEMILCMITSEATFDDHAVALREQDFARGSLHPKRARTLKQTSYVRPNRLLTVDENVVLRSVGQVADAMLTRVVERVTELISGKRA